MKPFKRLFFFLPLCLCLAGCGKQDLIVPSDYYLNDGSEDLTRGMNVVILEKSKLSDGIELGITGIVAARGNNTAVEYNCEIRDGKSYIVPVILKEQNDPVIVDDIRLIVPDDYRDIEKDITVIIRDKSSAGVDDASIDSIKKRFYQVLGRGVCANDPLGTMKYSLLDSALLQKYECIDAKTKPELTVFHKMASNFNSISKSQAFDVGVSFCPPLSKTIAFCLGINGNWQRSKKDQHSYEYLYATAKALMAEGTINEDKLLFGDRKGWLSVIDETINNVLNNPGTDAFKSYPLDTAGTYKLLDKYGTDFITGCQMGGYALDLYSKKKDLSEENIMWGVAAELVGNKKLDADHDHLVKYLVQKAAKQIFKINASYKEQTAQLLESMELEESRHYFGGNASSSPKTYQDWKVTDDPQNWIPIAYADEATLLNLKRGVLKSNPMMVPLWQLCSYTPRRELIKAALTPDPTTGLIPYYQHLGCYQKLQPNKMVVADVILINYEGQFSPQPGDDTPRLMQTPGDGKWRMYYPMMKNRNAKFHEEEIGYACDIQTSYFSGNAVKSRFYVYYALAWDALGVGLTDVRLGKDAGEGENTRGCYTDATHGYHAKDGHYYIIVKWANSQTKSEDKVTGVGLKYTDWDIDNPRTDGKGQIFASTGGTEWDKASGFGEPTAKAYFESYWSNAERAKSDTKFVLGENAKDTQNSFVWLTHFGAGDVRRPHTMHLCYTKKPIARNMTGYEEDADAAENIVKSSPICIPFKYGGNSYDDNAYLEEENQWVDKSE